VYSSSDGVNFTQLCEQMLTIENDSRERESYFYSVSYDANGGTGAPATAYYHKDHAANISATVPNRTGYVFVGWKVNGGEVKQPGAMLTGSITAQYTLVAQWVEAVDIKVNVVIDHTAVLGDDGSATKGDVTIELVSRPNDTAPWIEVAGTVLSLSEGSHAKHDYISSATETTYTANVVTYDGTALSLRGDRLYSLTAIKEGYELQSVTWNDSTKTLTATLKYEPEDFELSFSVATNITDSAAYPTAAIIRVLRWNSSAGAWEYIPQHAGGNPGVNVIIDPATGLGSGSVTVRKAQGTPAVPDDYRIEVSSLVYDGGIHALSGSGNVFSDSFYTATVQTIGTTGHSHNGLDGAYWDSGAQVGTLKAVITLGAHDVLFVEKAALL